MAVTRCVCFRITVAALREAQRLNGWTTLTAITDATGCGSGCGGCRPYLEAMLETGHTCFTVRSGPNPPQPCDPDPWDTL